MFLIYPGTSSARIPSNLSELHLLSVLNLSCNNLSGKIPEGTQLQSYDATSYMGNPQLCGPPLFKSCPEEQTHNDQNESTNKDNNLVFDQGFYISIALGFIVGFWGVFGSLVLIRSWRYAYFKLMIDMYNRLFPVGAVYYARLRRKFNNEVTFYSLYLIIVTLCYVQLEYKNMISAIFTRSLVIS